MRILIICEEDWNDYVYPNGILSNWFSGFDAEFAQIYCTPGYPINNICDKYFQITDWQMAKSLLGIGKAGHEIKRPTNLQVLSGAKTDAQRKGIYGLFKTFSLYIHEPVMFLRDFIWLNGKYDTIALKHFVSEFNPDVVFCPRLITPKLMRLERIVACMTSAPFIGFTADDEASIPFYGSFLFKLRKRWIHSKFAKHIKLYTRYFTFSEQQAIEYRNEYSIRCDTLYKCGEFTDNFISKDINNPIRLIYAGHIYCNRWKTLHEIGKALQIINKQQVKMTLDIYTKDSLSNEQRMALSEQFYIHLKGGVQAQELVRLYKEADIALHVESFDWTFKHMTRVSFSTKIIDLMASSCAIMAICWESHAGYQYLMKHDSAFCISNYDDIYPKLQEICDNPWLIQKYAYKAYNCGIRNHNKKSIQTQLYDIFNDAIKIAEQ